MARTGISVVIPAYNSASWIAQTLESVRAQGQAAIEIIVVDDGSTDSTADLVERDFPEAHLVRSLNRGASHARNLGTSLAQGEFIQYLDADDLLAAGKLQTQMEALHDTAADVAYGDWQKLVPSGGEFVPGEITARELEGDPEIALFLNFWCPPAAYLFRRTIVDKTGGWNETLPVIQDARFAQDCALHGGRFVRTPGIMAYYRAHESDSLSCRNPAAFVQDRLRNAQQIEQWWLAHGGMTPARARAVRGCLGFIARSAFELDPRTFEQATADLERLGGGTYIPEGPAHLRVTAGLIGYRRAEHVASWYRKAKRAFVGSRG